MGATWSSVRCKVSYYLAFSVQLVNETHLNSNTWSYYKVLDSMLCAATTSARSHIIYKRFDESDAPQCNVCNAHAFQFHYMQRRHFYVIIFFFRQQAKKNPTNRCVFHVCFVPSLTIDQQSIKLSRINLFIVIVCESSFNWIEMVEFLFEVFLHSRSKKQYNCNLHINMMLHHISR